MKDTAQGIQVVVLLADRPYSGDGINFGLQGFCFWESTVKEINLLFEANPLIAVDHGHDSTN